MIGNDVKVLFVSRAEIGGAVVSGSGKVRVVERGEWSSENLRGAVKQILKKLKTKEVRLLLGRDVSYAVELQVSKESEDVNSELKNQIEGVIPEELGESQWGYRELKSEGELRNFVVFAPVMSVFRQLSEAMVSAGYSASYIEVEEVATMREKEPLVGIAKANTDESSDEIKNLHLIAEEVVEEKEKKDTRKKVGNGKSGVRKEYLVLLVIVLLFGVGFLGWRFLLASEESEDGDVVENVEIVEDVDTEVVEQEELVLEDLRVQVLNGTGVEGAGGEVEELLVRKGFEDITLGNADVYGYVESVVRMKSQYREAGLDGIVEDVLEEYSIEYEDDLTDEREYDLIIIVGSKDED